MTDRDPAGYAVDVAYPDHFHREMMPTWLHATATALGLTGTEQSLLPGLGTGQGLWRIKDRSFVVQHQLHPAELAAFDTTTRMTEGVK